MNKETIEKAALDYVKQYYPASHPFKEHDVNVFVQGALWRINSVWHDGKEMPDYKKEFIYQAVRASGEVYYGFSTLFEADEWDFMKEFTTIERWAYVDDLVPGGKPTESAENFPQNSADFPRKFRECRKTSSGGKEAEQ